MFDSFLKLFIEILKFETTENHSKFIAFYYGDINSIYLQ